MRKIIISGAAALALFSVPVHAAENGFPLGNSPLFGGDDTSADPIGVSAELDNGGEIFVTPNLSTLGYGLDAGYKFSDHFALRGVYNTYEWEGTREYDGNDFDIQASLNSYGGMVDIHPFGGGLRVGVGARRNNNSAAMRTSFNGTFNYNGNTYTHPDETVVNGKVTFPTWAPVVTVGYHGNIGDHVSFGFDVGAMHHGAASVAMDASGGVADDPSTSSSFRNGMEEQRQDMESELSKLQIYPVAKFGMSIRF